MADIPLLGYTDRLSGRPGDEIAFKVSSAAAEPYRASLVRVICADPNPAGPGLQLEEVGLPFGGEFPSRSQPFHPGSHAVIPLDGRFRPASGLTLTATIWPTTPEKADQGIVSCGTGGREAGPQPLPGPRRLDRGRPFIDEPGDPYYLSQRADQDPAMVPGVGELRCRKRHGERGVPSSPRTSRTVQYHG